MEWNLYTLIRNRKSHCCKIEDSIQANSELFHTIKNKSLLGVRYCGVPSSQRIGSILGGKQRYERGLKVTLNTNIEVLRISIALTKCI